MLVYRWVTPSIKFACTHLYTWVERGTVRVKCLAHEHNTMSPARTWTARSGVEHTNHEATAPPTPLKRYQFKKLFISFHICFFGLIPLKGDKEFFKLVLFKGGKISSHAHKPGSWYILGVIFKISDEQLSFLYWESPPPPQCTDLHKFFVSFPSLVVKITIPL